MARLAVTGFAANATAGTPFSVVVTALDTYGNVITNYFGTIGFNSTDSSAVLPADYTFTTGSGGDNGVHTFTAALKTPGTQSITARDSENPSITGTQSGIVVSPAAASQIVFGQQPTSTSAGDVINPAVTVEIVDAYHNVITSDNSLITLTLKSGAFEGGSSMVSAKATSGVATFTGLKIDQAGSYTLSATDGLLNASSASNRFAINPAPAARLVLHTPPSPTATAGQAFAIQPVIDEEDRFGNLETGDSGSVVVASITSATGQLSGAITARLSGGIATFTSLGADTAGTVSITFDCGAVPAVSSAVSVKAEAAPEQVPPAPLTIISEQIVSIERRKKNGKAVAKPGFLDIVLRFSTAMNAASAGRLANYQIESTMTKHARNKIELVRKPVAFTSNYDASTNTVTLTIKGKQKFPRGGRLAVAASPPDDVLSADGAFLNASQSTFTILPRAKGITPSP